MNSEANMCNLNHPKVRQFTPEIASELQLDQRFVNFIFAKERPEQFRYWCEGVTGSWTCYIPDNVTVAYPLWSTNANQTLLLLTENRISYGNGCHDNPNIEMLSRTSQGLLATLLNSIWESEASEEEMREASEFCGFRYLDDLFEFVNAPLSEGGGWEQTWRQFVSTIDAKSIS